MSSYKAASAFYPNRILSSRATQIIIALTAAILILDWTLLSSPMVPSPWDVLRAMSNLWEEGDAQQLLISFTLNVEALILATILSLSLAYLSRVPAFRPLVLLFSKGRFLSMAGLSVIFTLTTRNEHQLKLAMLVFGISVFYVDSMLAVVHDIPKEQYDLARTLGMGEWHQLWEVVVLGRAEAALTALRSNAAMGWMMLTMVEGLARTGGGIGVALVNQTKVFHMDEVFAIQTCILLLGLAQDYGLGFVRKTACRYADLATEAAR